jgi:hypothetical protein
VRVELVHVLGSEPPIVAVNFAGRPEPGGPGNDSGFLVVFSDGPSPEEWAAQPVKESFRADRWRPVEELVEDYPELADAFEMAQWVGEVIPDGDGGWVPLDEVDE